MARSSCIDMSLEIRLVEAVRCGDANLIKHLLNKGANVNEVIPSGETAIGVAAKNSDVTSLRLLLDFGNSSNSDAARYSDDSEPTNRRSIKNRRHNESTCVHDSSGNTIVERTGHSDAVDNVRTNNASDRNNCGYFVLYHKTGDCEQDENDNCNLEGRTPEGMEQLEWDVEVKECDQSQAVTKEDDMWSCQYRWYADILDRTQGHLAVRPCVATRCDLNLQDGLGCTALHYAAGQGHLEVVSMLVEAGCQLDVCDSVSQTPLHLAAAHGHTAVVELMIDACHNPTRQNQLVNMETGDSRRLSALHLAAARGHWRTCAALLVRGAHVNALDSRDRTPLYVAVARHQLKTARLLLRHAANVNIEEEHGYTAICEAVWSKQVTMVALLASEARPTPRLYPAHQLLHYAVLHRHTAMVAQLLCLDAAQGHVNMPAHQGGDTPLIMAVRSGQVPVVEMLLQYGARPNAVNTVLGCTPLLAAVETVINATPSLPATPTPPSATPTSPSATPTADVTSPFEAIVELLVAYGADINQSNPITGYTPLTTLVEHEKFRLAAFLIGLGADVNQVAKLEYGTRDCMFLARSSQHLAMVQLIVYAGYKLEMTKLKYMSLILMGPRPNAVDDWLMYALTKPWPLTHLCRLVVRRHFMAHFVTQSGSRTATIFGSQSENGSQTGANSGSRTAKISGSRSESESQIGVISGIPQLMRRFIRMEDCIVDDATPAARLARDRELELLFSRPEPLAPFDRVQT
ncbi:serine/threonine-protein phosphatase 6 regulatory ankyrin repeat subunit B isoform X2 [Nilaparvata lugens]|uniref:serine/threonine-protein phosphatase 6 regulatory ankyrin repeat subunit B isoform X2 n=1 Tax=Nilaparvata lugens TaxID=108931 RepID=UPI00193E9394|nr:serine/threonine-protein phosphatase 6 regulatory ankyrin repeat subunit B isoform X2 [Nilaparvata lugens]